MSRVKDVVSMFSESDIRHGFSELELSDMEYGEEKREYDLDGIPLEFEGVFLSESEMENMTLENHPLDDIEESY